MRDFVLQRFLDTRPDHVANPAIASLLQSTRSAGRVAELGKKKQGRSTFLGSLMNNESARMPRGVQAVVGDYCYHVINCGNGRAEVFHAEGDYQAFVNLLGQ